MLRKLFACKHPAKYLRIQDKPSITQIEKDFNEIKVSLKCVACQEHLTIKSLTFVS